MLTAVQEIRIGEQGDAPAGDQRGGVADEGYGDFHRRGLPPEPRFIPDFLAHASASLLHRHVGEEVKQNDSSREHRREYRRKVQLCLDVFETMLTRSSFEFERPLTGMEIECNLVDAGYQPAMRNSEVLDSIADPAYQTELGAYNIEFNVPPRPLPGRAALELESDVRVSLNAAESKANSSGSHIVMIGILPTLMPVVNGYSASRWRERAVVLLGEHRRRHEDGHLLAVVDGLERGPDGDLGLAVADVAADQPVHRPGLLQVAP